MFSNRFYAWHLTAAGITDTVTTDIGFVHGADPWRYSAMGQMKFSPDCSKLALVLGNIDSCVLEVFDFNPATGALSNVCSMRPDSALIKRGYGLEFSSDGTRLYISTTAGTGGNSFLHQYSVTTATCQGIKASDTLIYNDPANPVVMGMQLGPDGKIYVVSKQWNLLGRINHPNLYGAAADFDSVVVTIGPSTIYPWPHQAYTLPSFVAGYQYHHTVPVCPRPTASVPDNIHADQPLVYPNPARSEIIIHAAEGIGAGVYPQFVLRDAVGRPVKGITVGSALQRIDVSTLAPGIYFYQLVYSSGSVLENGRLVIQ